jgi:hypothetical protein
MRRAVVQGTGDKGRKSGNVLNLKKTVQEERTNTLLGVALKTRISIIRTLYPVHLKLLGLTYFKPVKSSVYKIKVIKM